MWGFGFRVLAGGFRSLQAVREHSRDLKMLRFYFCGAMWGSGVLRTLRSPHFFIGDYYTAP